MFHNHCILSTIWAVVYPIRNGICRQRYPSVSSNASIDVLHLCRWALESFSGLEERWAMMGRLGVNVVNICERCETTKHKCCFFNVVLS